MELSWSDSEIPLSSFIEQFTLPQIVQIGEGAYGSDEETTLSRGQELNLHLVNDKQYYFGITESGYDVYIPLNSPHKVNIYYERSLTPEECSPTKLRSLFPKEYTHVRLKTSKGMLRALYFDNDMGGLVCLDEVGCEIVLHRSQLKDITVNEKSKEPLFIAEVNDRFKLPFTVQFLSSQSHFTRGVIHLQEIVNKKIIVATSRNEGCESILTFHDTLDVTVIPPKETTLANPEYRKLCENLNVNINVEEIENTIEKDDKIYDDVNVIAKIAPYAESFFGKRAPLPEKSNNNDEANLDEDEEGYIDIDGLFPKAKPTLKPSRTDGQLKKSLSDTTCRMSEEKESNSNSDGDDYEVPPVVRSVSDEYEKRFSQTRRKILESNRKAEDFTVQEIGLLLHELNLSQYGGRFEREQVDGKMLKDLDKEVLETHFKMTSFHAHKLKKATTENWRPSIQD